MLGDPASTGRTQNVFFKNKPTYQMFDTFEVFLKKSLNFIEIDKNPLDGESFVCHKPGLVVTNAPVHQDLHLDCKGAYKIKKMSALFTIYLYHQKVCYLEYPTWK